MSTDEPAHQEAEHGEADEVSARTVPRPEVNDVLPLPWDEGSEDLSADELNGEAPD